MIDPRPAIAKYLKLIWRYIRGRPLRMSLLLLGLMLAGYLWYLDVTIREAFEGRRFALPARVYARPLELYPGAKLALTSLEQELKRLGYRESPQPNEPGSFRRLRNGFELTTREFTFWDGTQSPQSLRVILRDDRIQALRASGADTELTIVRLDPPLIGGIYPGHNEDRALVKRSEVPLRLVEALLAIEDRKFYSHYGIDPRGIARAVFKTATGAGLQGGSTITQQLVKNFFLTSERTLSRKFTEVLMALLLELHYDKDDILETYINEVYLGQDANRAIHGFGLASHFYFDKPLNRLELHEIALLVGMVKGPSYFDPRRHADRARARRDLVLQEMARQQYISQQLHVTSKHRPLGVIQRPPSGTSPYPAFLGLVHRQLQRDYNEDDLRSEGLRIFTTLDPRTQEAAERALSSRLAQIERNRGAREPQLEGAVVVTSTQTSEVLAVVGGRDARFAGFNRAIDAARPVGSLIKPMVYLAALEQPERYTLATRLDDSPLVHRQPGTADWQPSNYDNEFHGEVPLRTALALSYNVATARLGLALGVERVVETINRFGVTRQWPAFAATLLGAHELSVIEVTQLYQTIADGGFRTPLRAIREILTAEGRPLQRYPLTIETAARPAPTYLLARALQDVVREGTAVGLQQFLPADLAVAGKTGTTDGLRDSWFAGFTGNRVAVVWVGRDDNEPAGLTGAGGAMTVWGTLMKQLEPESLVLTVPDDIEQIWVNPRTGQHVKRSCREAIELPFIKGSVPPQIEGCGETVKDGDAPRRKSWFERLFE